MTKLGYSIYMTLDGRIKVWSEVDLDTSDAPIGITISPGEIRKFEDGTQSLSREPMITSLSTKSEEHAIEMGRLYAQTCAENDLLSKLPFVVVTYPGYPDVVGIDPKVKDSAKQEKVSQEVGLMIEC